MIHADLGFGVLDRPVSPSARASAVKALAALATWQRSLRGWPAPPRDLPDALPFVALYAEGRLVGCMGSDEGAPGERLVRAFLRASSDPRFPPVAARDRPSIAVEASYVRDVVVGSRDEVLASLELGKHGLGVLVDRVPRASPVLLLPSVAVYGGLSRASFYRALLRKARAVDAPTLRLFRFETDAVVCRPGARALARRTPRDELDAAARWLAGLIEGDGSIAFARDPRSGAAERFGAMHYGRIATVVQALAPFRAHHAAVRRARAKLADDLRQGLSGRKVPAWPSEPALVAGSLALAVLAGVGVERELAEWATSAGPAIAKHPWHAAQVVAALGARAPAALWACAVQDLEARPWAPWTALAARARGDAVARERADRALVDAVRTTAPYEGGVMGNARTGVAEVALTAVTLEALAGSRSKGARAACRRGVSFLRRWQITAASPAFYHPASFGAFPAAPMVPILRCDVTAHALRAIVCCSDERGR